MTKIVIYTTKVCPYCIKAKALLDRKGVSYEEIMVDNDAQERAKMTARANGKRTVPQIFISNHHVGGCDDLYALEQANKLDALLAAN